MRLPMPKKWGATLHMLAEATSRVGQEYSDLGRIQKGASMRTFAAVVYVSPLVNSERQHLITTFKAMMQREKLPVPAGTQVEIAVPRMTGCLYAEVYAVSAEQAAQIMCSLMRRGLDEAGLGPVDEFHIEVEPHEEPTPPKTPKQGSEE